MIKDNDNEFQQDNFTGHNNNGCGTSENLAFKISEMGRESNIGVFEDALSFEQNGNFLNGSFFTEKQVSDILIKTAKKK